MKLFNLTCNCFSNAKTEQYNTRTQLSLEKNKNTEKTDHLVTIRLRCRPQQKKRIIIVRVVIVCSSS